jgi:hypothetical protein
MGRTCVAGHKNFGCKELEECSINWGRMASNPEEGQGSQRAAMPVMMMMMPAISAKVDALSICELHTKKKPGEFYLYFNAIKFGIRCVVYLL